MVSIQDIAPPAAESVAPPARMSIEHRTGTYLLDGEPVDVAQVILLGATLRRVMYPPKDQAAPGQSGLECQSRDGRTGYPTGLFPVDPDGSPAPALVRAAVDRTGPPLDCDSCPFTKWSSVPAAVSGATRRRRIHPRCTLQIAVPLLYLKTPDSLGLAVVAYQRSAEEAIRVYMRSFAKANLPAYSTVTRMRLNVNLGSGFTYSTPVFDKTQNTLHKNFLAYSALLARAREILVAPPPPRGAPAAGDFFTAGAAPAVGYDSSFFG